MRIFLTGATGYIGTSVAEAFNKAGHAVIGLARSDEAAEKLRRIGVEPWRGNLFEPGTIAAAARAADAVIHAATTNDASNPSADAATIDAVLGTLAGTGKPFLYTSGLWVHGETKGEVIDERGALNPIPLVAWRPAHERKVLGAIADGVKAMVIRPGIVFGRGGGIPSLLVQSAKEHGAARHVGPGENHWPTVHVDDLAELYVKMITAGHAGLVLLGIAETGVRVKDVAAAASPTGRTEEWPLEDARKTFGLFADAMAIDQKVSGERARTLLGWTPRSPGVLAELRSGSDRAAPV